MNNKNYLMVTMIVFGLIALLQLVRWMQGWPVSVNGAEVPLAVSAVAFVVTGGLATWAFMLERAPRS